jgi:uncharacterized phage protein (TIGR01671 family)
MNREIKFKAKRKDNNEWTYGYLEKQAVKGEEYYITSPCNEWINNCHIVIPETICQYTDLKDKNGVEIYENDILQLFDTINEPREKVTIKWNNESACYEVLQLNGNHYSFDVRTAINPCEVIGNIFDNSELLEKSDKQ